MRLPAGGTDGVGYLLKERLTDIGQLITAINAVVSGGSAIGPEVIARLSATKPGHGEPTM